MNKTKVLAVLLTTVLCFGACGKPETESNESGADSTAEKPSWETQTITDIFATYEIPASWEKSAMYSTNTLKLYTPAGIPIEENPSNVIVQISATGIEAPDFSTFTKEDAEEAFSAMLDDVKDVTFGDMFEAPAGGVWQATYTAEKMVDGEETPQTVQNTMFNVLVDNYSVAIFAADSGDNADPSAISIAEHIVRSLDLYDYATTALEPEFGTWEDDVYTSELLGLSFTLPANWDNTKARADKPIHYEIDASRYDRNMMLRLIVEKNQGTITQRDFINNLMEQMTQSPTPFEVGEPFERTIAGKEFTGIVYSATNDEGSLYHRTFLAHKLEERVVCITMHHLDLEQEGADRLLDTSFQAID